MQLYSLFFVSVFGGIHSRVWKTLQKYIDNDDRHNLNNTSSKTQVMVWPEHPVNGGILKVF